MKVIAHTGAYTVLVEAELDELAQIMGMRNTYGMPTNERNSVSASSAFPIGKEIRVNDLWKIIEAERGRPGAIKSAADNLRALATVLDGVNAALPMIE